MRRRMPYRIPRNRMANERAALAECVSPGPGRDAINYGPYDHRDYIQSVRSAAEFRTFAPDVHITPIRIALGPQLFARTVL